MSKTFDQKRLLELAGLKESKPVPSKINLQETFGNAFIQTLLLEEEEKEEAEEKEEEGGDSETASDGKDNDGDGETDEEDEGDLDSEDPSLSDSELAKGLKDGAAAMADAVPSVSNEDFANIINNVKDAAEDPQKLKKIADYIGGL